MVQDRFAVAKAQRTSRRYGAEPKHGYSPAQLAWLFPQRKPHQPQPTKAELRQLAASAAKNHPIRKV